MLSWVERCQRLVCDEVYLACHKEFNLLQVSVNGDDITDLFHAASVLYDVKRYNGPPCHPNPCREMHTCKPALDGYRCDPVMV